MADFLVKTDTLRSEADSLRALQRELNTVALRLTAIQISGAIRSGSSVLLNSRIRDCRNAVGNQAGNLSKLAGALDSVAQIYDKTEKHLKEPKTSALIDLIADGSMFDWLDRVPHIVGPGSWKPGDYIFTLPNPGLVLGVVGGALIADIAKNLPEEWSVKSGGISGSGDLWGIPCAGELGYSLLGYETDKTAKAKWKPEKGEAGLEYGGEVSGYLAKGDASGNIGILGGGIGGSVGNAAVSGGVNATLFEDGKFTPSIGAEVKGEASVLKGSAEGHLGSDDYNAHVNAGGTVLGAEAKGEIKAGVITYEDKKTGETVTSYGVKGEVGAEAYLAEGKLSGGFTIMGIDIDVGVSGKAGGAGVEAGGSVTADGVSGEIGAGLGLGGGVEVSVDWSDFDPPSLEDIGDGIMDVGRGIGKGIENAGEAVADLFNW